MPKSSTYQSDCRFSPVDLDRFISLLGAHAESSSRLRRTLSGKNSRVCSWQRSVKGGGDIYSYVYQETNLV